MNIKTFFLGVVLTLLSFGIAPASFASEYEVAAGFDLDADIKNHFVNIGMLEEIDGTLALKGDITRSEFVSAVVEYALPPQAIDNRCLQQLDSHRTTLGITYNLLFRDVSVEEDYALHLCAAMRAGMIWGYGDGNFRPQKTINFAEASKVLNVAFSLNYTMPEYQQGEWYKGYIDSLSKYTTFPNTVSGPSHVLSHNETSELLEGIGRYAAFSNSKKIHMVSTKRAMLY